jgi:hypothetical protein
MTSSEGEQEKKDLPQFHDLKTRSAASMSDQEEELENAKWIQKARYKRGDNLISGGNQARKSNSNLASFIARTPKNANNSTPKNTGGNTEKPALSSKVYGMKQKTMH